MQKQIISGIKGWKEDDRPREKCMLRGVDSLSDAELLAVLFGTGTRTQTAVGLGREVLKHAGNRLSTLGRLDYSELCSIDGIGPAKAVTLLAAMEIGRRRKLDDINKDVSLTKSSLAAEILMPLLSDLQVEEFWVLFVNHSNRCIFKKRVAKGGIHQTVVDPKIIFKEALEHCATGVILAHNHPSGCPKPSGHDISLTEDVKAGAATLGIRVLDHIIIGGGEYFSFSDSNIL